MEATPGFWFVAAFALSAIISGSTIYILRPVWRHYALARPNARSSHKHPTPQGGGIAILIAIIVVSGIVLAAAPVTYVWHVIWVIAAALLLGIVGAVDDVRVLAAPPRLMLQGVAVIVLMVALPSDLRLAHFVPLWLERGLIFFCVLWFVNLVNFMDGIDWMTVAEVTPVTAALAAFGMLGALPNEATLVALALCGAVIGFAPFNRPIARLFLGDVGSLPIGFVVAWLLVLLAGRGHLAAALLLPLYYLADATITLLIRLKKGEPIMQAHRTHFYQRALDHGFTVYQVVGYVFALNLLLIALAAVTIVKPGTAIELTMLTFGVGLTGTLLWLFHPPKR